LWGTITKFFYLPDNCYTKQSLNFNLKQSVLKLITGSNKRFLTQRKNLQQTKYLQKINLGSTPSKKVHFIVKSKNTSDNQIVTL